MEKILIVVDMQNDFIDGSLKNLECQKIVNNVSNYIKGFKGEIILTKDTHDKNYLKTMEGKKLPIMHCIKGTKGHDLNPVILKSLKNKKYKIIEKPTFGSTKLISYLKNKKFDEIIFVGVCTDICVISNVLLVKSFFPNKEIKVISSCCAGTSKTSHQIALDAMKMCHIEII